MKNEIRDQWIDHGISDIDYIRHLELIISDQNEAIEQKYDEIIECESISKGKNFLIAFVFVLFCMSVLLNYKLYQTAKLSDQDNRTLIAMFKSQETQRDNLLSMGWSEERADTFIENGCLNYIQVMGK